VNDACRGDQKSLGGKRSLHRFQRGAADRKQLRRAKIATGGIEGSDGSYGEIDPREIRERIEFFRTGTTARGRETLHDGGEGDFAVTHTDGVEERGQRFRRHRSRTSGDDERIIVSPVFGKKRDSSEIQHRQDIRVAQFVLEREADDIEPGKGTSRFERRKRKAVKAQLFLHIDPWAIHPFDIRLVETFEKRIQNLVTDIAHTDLVYVGKREAKADSGILLFGKSGPPLASDIS
jgi:hypothetical protein